MATSETESPGREYAALQPDLAPPGPAWREAEAYGFDMSLVEISLGKTPADRVREHDDAISFAGHLAAATRLR